MYITVGWIVGCRSAVPYADEDDDERAAPNAAGAGGEGASAPAARGGTAGDAAGAVPTAGGVSSSAGAGVGGRRGDASAGRRNAGAGGIDSSAGGGGAGRAPCSDDDVCDDALLCNGLETCVEGECVAGTPVRCDGDKHCVEDAEQPCQYVEPGPWILYETGERASPEGNYQLWLARATSERDFSVAWISEGVFDEEFWNSWHAVWSPDGKFLMFDAARGPGLGQSGRFDELDYENRLFAIRFDDAGLPMPAERIPDLPAGRVLELSGWDSESRAIALQSEGEIYVVRAEAGRFVTTLAHAGSEPLGDVRICAGGETVTFDGDGYPSLIPSDQTRSGERRRLFAQYPQHHSPDGRWIAATIPGDPLEPQAEGLVVTPCGPGEDRVVLAPASGSLEMRWSPNSRYLAIARDDVVQAAWRASDQTLVALPPYTYSGLFEWSEESAFLLLEGAEGEAVVFDVDTGRTTVLPTHRKGCRWVGDRVVASVYTENFPERRSLAVFEPNHGPEPVYSLDADPETFDHFLLDPRRPQLAYRLTSPQRLVLVRWDETGATTESVFDPVAPGGDLWLHEFTADGRGLIADWRGQNYEVWWFPTREMGSVDPFVIQRAANGGVLEIQSWP